MKYFFIEIVFRIGSGVVDGNGCETFVIYLVLAAAVSEGEELVGIGR